MVIDLKTGYTLEQANKDVNNFVEYIMPYLLHLRDAVHDGFIPTDDEMDDLEPRWRARQATPEDMETMARFLGNIDMIYGDDDPDEDRVNEFFDLGTRALDWRKQFRKEAPDGSTINTNDNTAN